MRNLILGLVFLLSLAAAAIAFTPLGFIIGQSGLDKTGAGWAKIDGTLLNGRISGFYIRNQPIGDVTLSLRPMSLLSLAPIYDVQWGGAGGRGTGVVRLSRTAVDASELRAQQEISAIEALAPPVRAIGGSVRISDGAIKLTRAGCKAASGQITTDALSRLAEQYGRTFGPLAGPVSCQSDRFLLNMAGQSQTNDRVTIKADASFLGSSSLDVRVETEDRQIAFALGQFGFTQNDGAWTYARSQEGSLP